MCKVDYCDFLIFWISVFEPPPSPEYNRPMCIARPIVATLHHCARPPLVRLSFARVTAYDTCWRVLATVNGALPRPCPCPRPFSSTVRAPDVCRRPEDASTAAEVSGHAWAVAENVNRMIIFVITSKPLFTYFVPPSVVGWRRRRRRWPVRESLAGGQRTDRTYDTALPSFHPHYRSVEAASKVHVSC